MAENLSKTFLLIAIATCGAFIVLLSFMNWVDFYGVSVFGSQMESFPLNGTEISRIQGATTLDAALHQSGDSCTCRANFGDGYLVAILGAGVLALASASMILKRIGRPLMASAVIASLAAFTIAGYNATGLWEGVGFAGSLTRVPVNLDGDVRAELFALTALAGFSTVLGAQVFAIATREVQALAAAEIEAEEALDDEDGTAEEVSGWA